MTLDEEARAQVNAEHTIENIIIPRLGEYVAKLGNAPMFEWTRQQVRDMIDMIIVDYYVNTAPLPTSSD